MQSIKLYDIIPPGPEYSYDPEEFRRLKDSIRANTLFHAIILQGDQPPYRIIAGRARFLAVKEIRTDPSDHSWNTSFIPATVLPESCPNPHEIALHENLRRNNLPWYSQVELEKELHELRVKEHGKTSNGRPSSEGKKGWSQNDTARELGLALGTFSQDMSLANALAKNPQLRNVKDKTTALKLVKQILKREIAESEQMLEADFEMDQVFLGDSEVILKSFPSESFDACITDPPWSEYKDESLRSDQERLLPIFKEVFRVLKRDSFLYIITSSTDLYHYQTQLPKIGFRVQAYPIIWVKAKTITHGRASWQYARDYEPIIVAVKGDPSLTSGREFSSIFNFDNLHYTKMIHPHEKPIELMKAILNHCTNPGAKVIDPFSGSGVTLSACKETDRRYIGIEKDKKFFDNIVKRLEK
jgi:adenine-specific DNA-methyltransferase